MTAQDFLVALGGDPDKPVRQLFTGSGVFGKSFAIPPISGSELRRKLGPDDALKFGQEVQAICNVEGGMAGIKGTRDGDLVRGGTVLFIKV